MTTAVHVDRKTVATIRRAVTHRKIPPAGYTTAAALLTVRLVAPDLTEAERAGILQTIHRMRRRGLTIDNPTQMAVRNLSLSAALEAPYQAGNRAQTGRLLSLATIAIYDHGRYISALIQAINESYGKHKPSRRRRHSRRAETSPPGRAAGPGQPETGDATPAGHQPG